MFSVESDCYGDNDNDDCEDDPVNYKDDDDVDYHTPTRNVEIGTHYCM